MRLKTLIDPNAKIECRCGGTEYDLKRSGAHIRADCSECGKFIKFVPQKVDVNDLETFEIPLPKYKGKTFKEVSVIDPKYIRWMAENLKGKLSVLAEESISEYNI